MNIFTPKQWLVLSVLFFILAAGEITLSYQTTKQSQTPAARPGVAVGALAPNAPVTVPVDTSGPGGKLTEVDGVMVSNGQNSLVVRTAAGNTTTINTGASTQIVSLGAPKSAQTVQSDLQTYNANVDKLMQDPQKNAKEIGTLMPPLTSETTSLKPTDLKVGDFLSVMCDGTVPSNSCAALRIIDSGTPPPGFIQS